MARTWGRRLVTGRVGEARPSDPPGGRETDGRTPTGARAAGAWWFATALLVATAAGLPPHRADAAWQNFQAGTGGLASNLIYAISEDPEGRIWVGTGGRTASRFDGTSWTSVADSLPPGSVFAVLRDHGGREWFGSSVGGLALLDGGRWRYFNRTSNTLPSNNVTDLIEDFRGDIWVATGDNGLARYQPGAGRWTAYPAGANQLVHRSVNRLFEDHDRRLWIATAGGASMLDSTRTTWTSFVRTAGQLEQDTVTAICEDRDGSMWFGSTQGVFIRDRSGQAWQHRVQLGGLGQDIVLALARDSTGRIWLGGPNGVAHTDGRTFRFDSLTSDGARIGPVARLLVDASGNLWLGGVSYPFYGWVSQGLYRYDLSGWRNFFGPADPQCPSGAAAGVPSLAVLSSNCLAGGLQDHAGEKWFASAKAGLSRLDASGAWHIIRRAPAVPLSDSLACLAEDHAGSLWFGSESAGLAELDSTRSVWRLHTAAGGLAANDVHSLFVDAGGELWAGTGAGVSRRSGAAWSGPLPGGPNGPVWGFAQETGGRMWIRASSGIYSVDLPGATARAWGTADGLPADTATALLTARDGSVWVGTEGGLVRFLSGTRVTWKTIGSAADSSIRSLYEDGQGGLWAGTDLGASRWDGSRWTSYPYPLVPGLPVLGFLEDSQGLIRVNTSGGTGVFNGRSWKSIVGPGSGLPSPTYDAAFEDGQLSLWFAGPRGLAEYAPDRVAPQAVLLNQPPALSVSRSAAFAFGAAYGEVADLEYSTSWDGAPYSAWSSDNAYSTSGLPDGAHTFRVRSRDWAGNLDPTPATYTFEVDATPPPAVISYPAFGQPVRGRVPVTGTAADPRFHDFVLQARPADVATWTDARVRDLAASASPAAADTLAHWDTAPLADGDWDLRLAVHDTLGLEGIAQIRVIVDNLAPFANVTSPVRLVARDGGDVFTTDAEVHVYFPPNAFDADPLVSVDSTASPAPPDTIAGGAQRRGAAWTIGWTGARLTKPGVLEMRPALPGGALAIWRDEGGGQWSRVGGSPQPGGALGFTLSAAGRYALYSDVALAQGQGGITALALTPRAFSPAGHYAARELSIGFALARPGGATIKLYNRAGRLVRTVTRGMSGEAGQNLVHWDGRDDDGRVVDPGLYLVTVEALGETKTQTLAVVR